MMQNRLIQPAALLTRLLLVLLMVSVASGCGTNSKKKRAELTKPAKLSDIERRVKLSAQWSRGIGDGQGKDYHRLTLGVSAKGVCASSVDGKIACFSHKGKKQWKTNIGERISAGIGVSETLAMVVDSNGTLYVLDRDNGELRWEKTLHSQVLAAPQANNDIVVVQTTDGRVLGLDPGSGKKRWEYRTDEPRLTLRGTATPVIEQGVIYTGFASGKLVALNATDATIIFDQMVALASGTAEIDRIVDIDASPTLTTDAVYSASFNGNLFAFDKRSGRPRWRVEASSYRELASGLAKVYLVDESSRVFAFDAASSDERWLQSALLNRKLSAPSVFAGYLVVADYKGYLHVLSQVDGAIVGRTRADRAGVRVPMRTYADSLYVYTDDGKLVAYQLEVLTGS